MFADWRAEVVRQGEVLDLLIRRQVGPSASTVLDCACRIGTQAIGLATHGYTVAATDLSPAAVERAAGEAASFGGSLTFDVADFRAPLFQACTVSSKGDLCWLLGHSIHRRRETFCHTLLLMSHASTCLVPNGLPHASQARV
jgi:SAM-dependent methyltransferase